MRGWILDRLIGVQWRLEEIAFKIGEWVDRHDT